MKLTFTAAATVTALAISGVPAHAGCSDPRTPAQSHAFQKMPALILQKSQSEKESESENGGKNIVGTWHVSYTAGGSPFGEAFIQWHSDGTEWENIDFPVLGGNICMGSWKPVGTRHFSRNHIGWLYDNGKLSGYFTETETDEVAFEGNSYSGLNDSKIYDLKNNLLAEVQGTAMATRIAP